MRSLVLVVLLVLAACPAGAQMWDLPEGRWVATDNGPAEVFEIEVGSPESKTFTLTCGEQSKDSRYNVVSGTYKVTANKGDPHFTWEIESVSRRGNHPPEPRLGELPLSRGDSVRGIFHWEEGDYATITFFDQEIQPVLTRRFQKRH